MTSEADTCRTLVTPRLYAAGWTDEQIREQVYAPGRIAVVGARAGRTPSKRADYVLRYRRDAAVAVVEAKKSSVDVARGIQQAKEYANRFGVRFAYATNGTEIVEVDLGTGLETRVPAFPGPDELWSRFKREDGVSDAAERVLLTSAYRDTGRPIRCYQEVAIARALRALVDGAPRVLVTMATGCGKTTVAFQVCWRLWKSEWNRRGEPRKPRILFLADRRILVDDPYNREFSAFGDARHRIGGDVSFSRDMYFATYQSLAEHADAPGRYREYPRDFFDLVVVDECHRGSANEEGSWREILDWFEGAAHFGMTATPKRAANTDTYDYFGEPVYTYSLRQGIEDGYLAPYVVHRVVTTIDATGYRPAPGETDVHGRAIPDALYGTPDFDRRLAHAERTRAIARHLTDHLRNTDRFAKTLVFGVDQEHADELRRELSNLNADLVREHADYACRVTADEGDVGTAHLGRFQDVESRTPVILTTSQMLTTGVDAPMVRNIAIVRCIGSMTEFKQIIGRGTRVREEYGKLFFTILDYTGSALQRFADPEFDGEAVAVTRQRLDDDGAVIDEVTEDDVGAAALGAEAGLDDVSGGFGADPTYDSGEPRRKLHVNGRRVEIGATAVYHLGPDGRRLVVTSIRDYAREAIRTLDLDEATLRSRWAGRATRDAVMDELEARGVSVQLLVGAVGGDASHDADPLDLLLHLAFGRPIGTRGDRVVRVRREHREFFERFSPEARGVLDLLLERYAESGIEQLSEAAAFRNAPFSDVGTLTEIAARFGGADQLNAAREELQRLIYAA